MISKKDIEKLQRFSKGLASAEEEKHVHSLLAKNVRTPEFKKHLQEQFNEYLKTHPDENHSLSYLLDRIHHIIHKQELQKKDTLVKRIYKWYSVAAAVLLIPLLIAGAIWINRQSLEESVIAEAPATSTIFAPLGSRISFSLPDGTQGWLNSGSSLEYSIPFNNNRQIAINGEAWFDVIHDSEHPFEIAAGNSKIKVLGTKFNLNAYPDDKYLGVALEEGKVEFTTPGLVNGIELKPNEHLVFSNNSINIKVTDASKLSGWKEGKLIFRYDTMEEVARRISRWFNVSVEVVDEELKTYSFRGTFQDDSLEEVIHYISSTSPMSYRIIERKKLDDGTVAKKKVLLYKKNS